MSSQNDCPSASAVWLVHRRRRVPRRRTRRARSPRPSIIVVGTVPRSTWTSRRKKSTWTSRRSGRRTIATQRRVLIVLPPRHRLPVRLPRRRRPIRRIHRKDRPIRSASRLSSGQIHPRPTFRTSRRLIGTRLPRSVLTRELHRAPPSYIRLSTFRVDYYRRIRTIHSPISILSCCPIIYCRPTCTRSYAGFILDTRLYTRLTRLTGYIIPIR